MTYRVKAIEKMLEERCPDHGSHAFEFFERDNPMTPFEKDVERAMALLSEDTEQAILFLLARLLDQRKDLAHGKARELRERGIQACDHLRNDPKIAGWKVRADFDARHVLDADGRPGDQAYNLGALSAEIQYNEELLAYAMEIFKKEKTS